MGTCFNQSADRLNYFLIVFLTFLNPPKEGLESLEHPFSGRILGNLNLIREKT